MKNLTIRKPDDWHLHLREGDLLKNIIKYTSNNFGRAVIMPNTKVPITNIERALSYRDYIIKALPKGSDFNPLMTIYLTDETNREELKNGYVNRIFFWGKIISCKRYY